MHFPKQYRIIPGVEVWADEKYALVPIRYEDRADIMKWRNEQIYHLRQKEKLTKLEQDLYFKNIVRELFEQSSPSQLLFSYIESNKLIGYGGLVNIDWEDSKAEISFIMDTELENDFFSFHWVKFLSLIEKIAFEELGLLKIYTYAYDIRPHLYDALALAGYSNEAILKDHHEKKQGTYFDVVIHSKLNEISFRNVKSDDKKLVFQWSNDEITRQNSFNPDPIDYKIHSKWFIEKIVNDDVVFHMFSYQGMNAGVVRFESHHNEGIAIIGINIAPAYRGLGLAKKFIRISCNNYLRRNSDIIITAYVKTDNVASIKTFTNSGFVIEGKETINNFSAKIFKLKCNIDNHG